MASIFISYRHSDAAGHARLLYERFAERFGEANVFKDLDSTELGADYEKVIKDTLAGCDALIAVIGKDWLEPRPDGTSRLRDRGDWVRMELANALKREEVRVVPVLVAGAKMPSSAELPKDVLPLTRRQAVVLVEDAWNDQVTKMLDHLERVIAKEDRARGKNQGASAIATRVRVPPRGEDQDVSAIATRARVRPLGWKVQVRRVSDRTRVLELRRGQRAKHELTVHDGTRGSPAARVMLDGETQSPMSGRHLSWDLQGRGAILSSSFR